MNNSIGSAAWLDLTVPDAESVRAFYERVVGWTSEAFNMGDYSDYSMKEPDTGKTVSGVCHARGSNAGIPPVWLVYFMVRDLDASLAACVEAGGAVLHGPRDMGGYGRMAIIRDPAGAVCALSQGPATP